MQPDKSEKFIHGTKDLCEELDKRIAKLDQFREKLQGKIYDGINVQKNSESLSQVTKSLFYSREARRAMEGSCCIFSCEFFLHEKPDPEK